jgi:4'-phosphopantetheinyl transferase
MPLIFDRKEADFLFGIWRMDEEPDELLKSGVLSGRDVERVHSFQSIARKKEWICTRMLLSEMMPGQNLSIDYDDTGKPHLRNSKSDKEVFKFHISVSHTKNYVAVIVSEKYPVAIDIELIHLRIEKLVHKFVSDAELRFIPSENKLQHYFLIWSAKECLYKMYGRKELLFKEHLHVQPFRFNNSGEMDAAICKNEISRQIHLDYFFEKDLLIVYAIDRNP